MGLSIDREKVIKELENAPSTVEHGFYFLRITHRLRDDALDLLKKQKTTMVIESENMYTGLPITHCPKCGKSLDRYLYGRRHEGEINFCPYCGQAVKWDA